MTHAVTIVLFSRVIYDGADDAGALGGADIPANTHRTAAGQLCRDFYRVVAERESPEDWSSAFTIRLKQHFASFREDLRKVVSREGQARQSGQAGPLGEGRLAYAQEGNFLEAVSLSLNTLGNRYRGRDVRRTGESIIVVSA